MCCYGNNTKKNIKKSPFLIFIMIKDFVKIIIDFIAFNHAQSFVIFFEINKKLCDILGVPTGAGGGGFNPHDPSAKK